MRSPMFAFLLASLFPMDLQAVGFERTTLASVPPIEIGIWYPSSSPVPDAANTLFDQALALDGSVKGTALPLIILSHGNGGWMGGHVDTALALAEAGFVSVALTHPGDNYRLARPSAADWLVSRPTDISKTVDYMLSDWAHADRIDTRRIGVYGFSAGGYTALVIAGGLPDFSLLAEHCDVAPEEFTCRIGMFDDLDPVELEPLLRDAAGDDRVAAISVAAPGFGFAFGRAALANVTVPVQIWSGTLDKRAPHETNGATIADNLAASPDVHVVQDAGHFAFLSQCHPRLKTLNFVVWNRLCVDAEGFDRAAFHQTFHLKLVEFFTSALVQ